MRVQLDPGEMATARVIATLRRYVNEVINSKETHFSPNIFDDEMNGAVAELAFAKHWNVYPDTSSDQWQGSYDCIVNGQRIDVKAVTKRNHKLIAPIWKTSDSTDVYVLGVVTNNEVDFVGWARADELICDAAITDLGHGPTYVLNQSQLRPFKTGVKESA